MIILKKCYKTYDDNLCYQQTYNKNVLNLHFFTFPVVYFFKFLEEVSFISYNLPVRGF